MPLAPAVPSPEDEESARTDAAERHPRATPHPGPNPSWVMDRLPANALPSQHALTSPRRGRRPRSGTPGSAARALYRPPTRSARCASSLANQDASSRAAAGIALAARRARAVAGGRAAQIGAHARKALAYAVRMATRCTPFGLFASSGAVESGPATTLALAGDRPAGTASRRRWRGCRPARTARAEHRDTTVIANDLVVERGSRLYAYHDAHARQVADGARAVWRQDAGLDPLERRRGVAARRSRARSRPFRRLVGRVMERFGAAPEIAHQLVHKLIEAAVLVPVRPSLQAIRALRALAAGDCRARAVAARARRRARCVRAARRGDRSRPTSPRSTRAVRAVHALDGAVVQVDGFHAFTGTLGARVRRDVALLASIALAHEAPAALRGSSSSSSTATRPPTGSCRCSSSCTTASPSTATSPTRPPRGARACWRAWRSAGGCASGRREVVLTDAELRALLPRFEPYRVPQRVRDRVPDRRARPRRDRVRRLRARRVGRADLRRRREDREPDRRGARARVHPARRVRARRRCGRRRARRRARLSSARRARRRTCWCARRGTPTRSPTRRSRRRRCASAPPTC